MLRARFVLEPTHRVHLGQTFATLQRGTFDPLFRQVAGPAGPVFWATAREAGVGLLVRFARTHPADLRAPVEVTIWAGDSSAGDASPASALEAFAARVPGWVGEQDRWAGFYASEAWGQLPARLVRARAEAPGLRLPSIGLLSQNLLLAITEQRVTGIEAMGGMRALLRQYGEPAPATGLPDQPPGLVIFPQASVFAQIPDWAYHHAGFDRSRSSAMVHYANRAESFERFAAQLFYPWQKTATLGLLLLTGVLAWTTSPLALIAAPTLIWRFLSPQEGYWEPTWHYNLVLMPIVFTALLDVLARATARTHVPAYQLGATPAGRTVRTIFATLRHRAPVALPALALIVSLGFLPNQPLAQLADPDFATTELSTTDQMKAEAVAAIPEGATVAADLSVLTYLVPNHTAYWIGHSGEPGPDYVLVDKLGSAWGGNPPTSAVAYATGRYGDATYVHYRTIGSIDIAVRTR